MTTSGRPRVADEGAHDQGERDDQADEADDAHPDEDGEPVQKAHSRPALPAAVRSADDDRDLGGDRWVRGRWDSGCHSGHLLLSVVPQVRAVVSSLWRWAPG